MGRRSSGWTIVKAIARDIDRANRQHQRAVAVQQRAYIREQERSEREARKYVEQVTREATRIQDKFNRTLAASNGSNNPRIKEEKLEEAKSLLSQLKEIDRKHSFFELTNLSNVENSIKGVQSELDELKQSERSRLSLEEQAVRDTEEANSLRDEISKVLLFTLSINDAIDWEGLKDKEPFLVKEPHKPPVPIMPPMPQEVKAPQRPEISWDKYQLRIPFYLHLFKEKKRLIIDENKRSLEFDLEQWGIQSEKIKAENEKAINKWKKDKEKLLNDREASYQKACAEWLNAKNVHFASQDEYNKKIDAERAEYLSGRTESIEEYSGLVLSRSEYPFIFSKDYKIQYIPEAKLLALDYQLPSIDVVPTLKEAKFIRSRHEVKQTFITEKMHKEIYENLLYAMLLRTVHELFEADVNSFVNAIAINGWVTAPNKATGHDDNKCIMTLSVNKEEFLQINLANVDLKECFKSLKGIGSSRLSDLVPVAPVIALDKGDKRFVESYNVICNIEEGDNLAVMNWEDFEHLIRELFEQEFSSNGSEVKVTQASRDGGVDAVIYDPDPVRGGKIVIQAKRYSNTVGVSAVRDLYGTVQHEGAMKGILITTSNYGNDAYDFAKGKPITLMNGGNLIHLLERHGRKARINLAEAKAALKG